VRPAAGSIAMSALFPGYPAPLLLHIVSMLTRSVVSRISRLEDARNMPAFLTSVTCHTSLYALPPLQR
jgi:hypothetical protein